MDQDGPTEDQLAALSESNIPDELNVDIGDVEAREAASAAHAAQDFGDDDGVDFHNDDIIDDDGEEPEPPFGMDSGDAHTGDAHTADSRTDDPHTDDSSTHNPSPGSSVDTSRDDGVNKGTDVENTDSVPSSDKASSGTPLHGKTTIDRPGEAQSGVQSQQARPTDTAPANDVSTNTASKSEKPQRDPVSAVHARVENGGVFPEGVSSEFEATLKYMTQRGGYGVDISEQSRLGRMARSFGLVPTYAASDDYLEQRRGIAEAEREARMRERKEHEQYVAFLHYWQHRAAQNIIDDIVHVLIPEEYHPHGDEDIVQWDRDQLIAQLVVDDEPFSDEDVPDDYWVVEEPEPYESEPEPYESEPEPYESEPEPEEVGSHKRDVDTEQLAASPPVEYDSQPIIKLTPDTSHDRDSVDDMSRDYTPYLEPVSEREHQKPSTHDGEYIVDMHEFIDAWESMDPIARNIVMRHMGVVDTQELTDVYASLAGSLADARSERDRYATESQQLREELECLRVSHARGSVESASPEPEYVPPALN